MVIDALPENLRNHSTPPSSGDAAVTPPSPKIGPSSSAEPSPYKPLLAFIVVALLIALTAYAGFQRIEGLIEQDKLAELGAVADMKADQIAEWRNNHKRLGEAFARNSVLSVEFGLWLQDGMHANQRMRRLQKMLMEMQSVHGYETIFMLDRQGIVRISTDSTTALGEEHVRQAMRSMDSGEVVFMDFHRNSRGNRGISIDLIVPLTVAEDGQERAVGAAVLQIDPYEFLYPLIQSWPTRSPSAETQLVRQEGGDVLYLNELRHQKDTALALQIPLSTPNLVAAMAVRGEVSAVNGVDYRGVPVVSEMRRIPGTSWFVVSKMDREELFAPIYQLRAWSIGLGITYVAIGGLLAFVWLRGHKVQFRYLRMQHDAAVEREMLVKHFEYLTRYANDIILVADEAGRIVEANERAQEAYGYTREELLRMSIFDFRDPAEDPAVFKEQIKRFKEAGELRYETTDMRKDGSTFPVEVSARLVEVEGVKYIQGIMRDISERKRAEDALRRSETLLKESQQMAHIGSWELDLINNILYWTEENYRIFEIDRSLFGASYEAFLNTVHPDDRALVDKAYTESVKNRTPYVIVHRLLFPQGRIKHVREWCETFYDEAGRPLRSIGTTQDITEQQLAQDALSESVEEIEDLYNNAPCGYHSLDADGRVIRINNTELAWLGYARDEVVGKKRFADLLTHGSLRIFHDNYPAFKERGFVHDLEYELIRKDGTIFPVLLNATALYDADGRYVASRSTLFDITARKLAEKKLGESEERFRTMADNAPIMIWMSHAQDRDVCLGCDHFDEKRSSMTSYPGSRELVGCNYFNRRWYEFTGLPVEHVPSCYWQDVIHVGDKMHCLEVYMDAFEKRQPFRVEYRLRCHDGVFRWVEDSGVPRFAADGEYLGFIGTCTDLTERKLFETLRAEVEHMDRFNIAGEMASGLAHEISQPLTAANNYLDGCLRRMAEGKWDHAALLSTIKLAHGQTERAGKIIGHLKDIVRKHKYERTLLDVNLVVKDSIRFLEYELQRHHILVTLNLSGLPPVLANRIEIEQVLINLIKNSIDSMSSTPRRELHIVTGTTESGEVLVTVGDTGKGVAAEDVERIFNPFQTSKKDGLGLGLAICRSLIESYGGKIWAEQKEGAGVKFNFTLTGEAIHE
jgi:PAS domain S-box-containing protein